MARMNPVSNVTFIRSDIMNPEVETGISRFLLDNGKDKFDVILSDAMIKTSGSIDVDHSSSYLICERVMKLSSKFLKNEGKVLVKQFQGDLTKSFIDKWKIHFQSSRIIKPKASRQSSSEIYILFKGFRA